MCRSRKFCQRGSNFEIFFFPQGREDPNKYHYKWAIIDPPAKRHLTGVSLAGPWRPNIVCWIGSFVILRGSWPVLLRNPIFCNFPGSGGVGGPPVLPSGSAHACAMWKNFLRIILGLKQLPVPQKKYPFQGSYRQVWVKFKDFSRTSKDYPTVFKD